MAGGSAKPRITPMTWAVAAVFLLAALVRILPVNYGAPEPGYFSSDEIDSVSRGLKMASGDLLPIHANKPTHYVEIVAAAYGAKFLALNLFTGVTVPEFEKAFFLEPFPFYRIARGVSIAASVGVLALLLWSLRREGRGAQLLALIVIAFASSSVKYGHIAKEDALAAFWTFAAFAFAVEVHHAITDEARMRRAWAWLCASAAAAGLALSTKYNCFFAGLFPAGAAWFLMPRQTRLRALAAAAGASFCAFAAGTPYALLHPVDFVSRTLASNIVSEVGHGLATLNYADKFGFRFLMETWKLELGLALAGTALATALFAWREPRLRALVLLPFAIYMLVLLAAGHLDYQYVIVLTPLLAWVTGYEMYQRAFTRSARAARLLILALVVVQAPVSLARVAKRTSEYLGGDTRNEAGAWLNARAAANPAFRSMPLLIASPFYHHYFPAVAFTPETYEVLRRGRIGEGGEGGYFRKAALHAAQDPRTLFDAEFLDVKTYFTRKRDGTREFLKQPYPLNLASYAGRYSALCVPDNTFQYLDHNPPETPEVVGFYRAVRSLPVLAEFQPRPWHSAGPAIWVFRPPQVEDNQTSVPGTP